MNQHRVKVHCDDCEHWLPVDPAVGSVTCDCGRAYIVTVTGLPNPTA